MLVSLVLLVHAFDLSSAENVSRVLGSVHEKRFEVSVTRNGQESHGTLLGIAHGYSVYDRTQLSGRVDDVEAVAGALSMATTQDPKLIERIPVIGLRLGSILKVRPVEIVTLVRDRKLSSEEIRLWLESKAAAQAEDRELELKIVRSSTTSSKPIRAAGYSMISQHAGLAGLDRLASSQSMNDFQVGIMAIAWPYRSREEFSKSRDSKVQISAEDIWKLGRALEAKEISQSEEDLMKLSSEEWHSLSMEVFNKAVNLSDVIKEAKAYSSVPVLDQNLEPIEAKVQEGSLADAFGCSAAQIALFPMIGINRGNETQWIHIEFYPHDPKVYKFRVLEVRSTALEILGDTSTEQIQPGFDPVRTSGRMKLRVIE